MIDHQRCRGDLNIIGKAFCAGPTDDRAMHEVLRLVVEALSDVMGDKRYTTREMEDLLFTFYAYRCPDDLSRSLNKLRLMGVLCGEVDREQACWVWWLPKKDQPE